jgi:hypothetical protein
VLWGVHPIVCADGVLQNLHGMATRSRAIKTTPQDPFWWSARNGGTATVYSASSKQQAIATIAEDFLLAEVHCLQLVKHHAIEVDKWSIALQQPDESSEDFFDRSCRPKKTSARPHPKHSDDRKSSTTIARGFRFFNM